ncbi:HET domain-containing protein [Fusarium keratoplasticum]|nr:HET domain-containing protein [Fusarium keratoplasticum]
MRTLPDVSTLENGGKFEDSPVFLEMPEDNSMPHKSVRTELRASSLQGCLMCTWLLQSLNSRSRLSNRGLAEEWRKRPATIELDPWESHLSNRCINHYRLTLRCPAPPPSTEPLRVGELMTFDVHGKLVRPSAAPPRPYESLRGDELASLVIDVMPSSPLSQSLLTALMDLEQETPSSATWNLFGIWLRTCEEDHPECRGDAANRSQQAPARLIDIQSADRILLVETSMLTGEKQTRRFKYATLSHCWGNTHEPQLNKSTAMTLKQGISLQELPRLYYDAVILARHLQIPYIWIDSLCIIQDSVDDWRRESSKMGSIYEGSYLCIAASAATNNSAGFLHKHSADWPQPLVHGNLVISADVDMAETNMNMSQPKWCNRMRTLSEWAVDMAPLNQRAWVLQERLFAPRILHCTADEFVWECRRGMRSESHPVLTCGGSMVKDVWRDIHQAPPDLRQPSPLLDRRLPCLDRWSQVVGFFTSLGITFPQDRLPAVSAVAKQLQPVLGNYAAGLWENFMPSQLLWRHACIIECKKKHSFRQNHSPSWSWSSLDCKAVLPKYMDEKIDNFPCAESRPFDKPVDLDAATHVKILKVNVNFSGHDAATRGELGELPPQPSKATGTPLAGIDQHVLLASSFNEHV